MTSKRTAIVVGGSGSVGTALLRELLRDDAFGTVIALSRRPLPESGTLVGTDRSRLVERLVPDMRPEPLAAATINAAREVTGELEGFSTLGIGAGTANLTLEEHRAVDVALNEAFARALRDSGKVRYLAFLSAAGADATAKTTGNGAAGMPRYRRVKGESEEAVRANGPAVVSVFRPGMIIGSQHTPWLLEKVLPLFSFLTPAKYKSIRVEQIAKAMIATAKDHPASSAVYHYPEMMALLGDRTQQPRWAKLATYNTGFAVDLLCVALDAKAIPYLVKGIHRGAEGAGYQGLVAGGIDVLVPEDALEEARLVLASSLEAG